MNDLLNKIDLPNGLAVNFYDRSCHYYGGFFHVSILAQIEFEFSAALCPAGQNYDEAVSILGRTVRYGQKLERMGVKSEDTDSVKALLIEKFIEASKGYISDQAFPARIISAELLKATRFNKPPQLRF